MEAVKLCWSPVHAWNALDISSWKATVQAMDLMKQSTFSICYWCSSCSSCLSKSPHVIDGVSPVCVQWRALLWLQAINSSITEFTGGFEDDTDFGTCAASCQDVTVSKTLQPVSAWNMATISDPDSSVRFNMVGSLPEIYDHWEYTKHSCFHQLGQYWNSLVCMHIKTFRPAQCQHLKEMWEIYACCLVCGSSHWWAPFSNAFQWDCSVWDYFI